MTLCENCKTQLPTMKTRLNRVNEALHTLGREYHERIPYAKVDAALEANGFEIASTQVLGNETGSGFSARVGEDKWLHLSWYRMPSGRFEVTAYVN